MEGYPHKVVRFGVFEADLQTGELRKSGIKVALQGQPFQVFAILLEHSGQLVSREELRQRVWPKDTFVDFDHALNTAITKIRIALGDDADNPRFVETLPRRGYRFIGSVDKPSSQAPQPRAPKGRFDQVTRRSNWVRVGGALLVLLAAIGIWRFGIPGSWFDSPPAPKSIPLTSYPGLQCCPSFSPDGNQVAFVWTGPKQDNSDIYVKLVGTENAVRLTTDPARDVSPAWSPDGRFIAFLRVFPPRRVGVFLVSPIGGPERKLTEIWGFLDPDVFSYRGVSWFPDSKSLAVSDQGRIITLSVNTGEKHTLTFPPRGPGIGRWDDTPAVSPDGRSVVFSRDFTVAVSEIYLLTLSRDLAPNGEPKQLTFKQQWSRDPLWTANGREVIFSSGPISYLEGVAELWRMPVSASGEPAQPRFIGVQGAIPALSRQGKRLAYMRTLTDANIWRLELPGPRDKASEPIPLISSTQNEDSPQYSPDGKRVVFCSSRSGTREIWVASADGSDTMQLTSLGATMAGAPRWSPDGQQIVFDSTVGGVYDVYVIDANGGKPRRLTDHPATDAVASYSRDGRWIYFLSRRTGGNEIWKVLAEGGQAVRVTKNGGWIAFESPDGKMLYYTKDLWNSSLWRMPVEGGEEKEIVKSIVGFSFSIAKKGIYFQQLNSDRTASIKFLSFATGEVAPLATIRRPLSAGMSVSPDERYILYTQLDQHGSDLMLIENFR